ncbi:LPXTG-motif cell wall-anchored protein [Kibdelosporangium banguiense]|uniref:LPXTG-motif cell wall-anchored protein n=1 Tax=Kibdelosporangium banguiense TaxID=1365924 RepID=A0ABS4TE57_9PSEU|nr:LPXTG cell wall anchor domain-containing protein [Kibdelosporangium banguiense]MBP2322690.1 LPXTG-motif cell wall-anchored protein [Kibdelosporangium banguiense]
MKRNVLRALAALVLSVGVSQAGVAFADDTRPSTGTGSPATCRSAGLPGDKLEVTATVRDNTYIDITAVPSGYQLTGVLVQGLRTYSKYTWLGDLPWNNLQAPQAVAFTSWFACAKPRTLMPTTAITTTTATTTATSSSSSAVATTTSTTTAAAARAGSELAETGFNGGWLVFVGGGLLVAGAAVLSLSRARRRS